MSLLRSEALLLALAGLAFAALPAGAQGAGAGDAEDGDVSATAGDDAYLRYVRTAAEFQPLRGVDAPPWPTWTYMPWYWKWTIGHDEAAARFCREYGINGGFMNYGRGPLLWLERNGLHFYNDHTAGKGLLYVRGANNKGNFAKLQRDPRAVRTPPLDAAALRAARDEVRRNMRDVRRSDLCRAYALDDEISWGAFVLPLPWRVHEDDEAYARWLRTYHGRPVEPRFVTPDFAFSQLDRPLAEIDFAPFLDRMTYNDSVFANFVGALVDETNANDMDTPAGFVGGQNPSLWGGYDYAKLRHKVQFLEVYDMGSAPEIVRSFGSDGRIASVSTHFHDAERPGSDTWKAWYRFAHGQRGMIGWVDDQWFDEDGKPRPWLEEFAPALRELGRVQGPKTAGARFVHDGIALYYSHPSIQVSWLLDAEAHGKTWPNRGRDHLLGTSHNVRRAWEYLLADAGLQYEFLAYDRVVREGVPDAVDVLVLPACYALSDVEARRIAAFAARGGRVVADFMCGLFDPHGKGRSEGALDALFGVRHDGAEKAADFFGGRLWVETDQDAGFGASRWSELPEVEGTTLRDGFVVAERRLDGPFERRHGEGTAVYLNLSPQRYLRLREEGFATAKHRAVFVGALGKRPFVEVEGAEHCEVLRWRAADGRLLLFVVQNPVLHASGEVSLARGEATLALRFAREVSDVRDERTGETLGDGDRFEVPFVRTEAVFLSYRDED